MLTLNTRSHSAGVTSMNSVGELTPATLASPMIGGRADSTCAMAACTEFSSEMSAPTPRVDTEYLSATSVGREFGGDPVDVQDRHGPPVAGQPVGGGPADASG